MWAGSDKMNRTQKKIKKRNPILLFFMVVITVVIVLIDIELFQYRWRPEAFTLLSIYAFSAHLLSIGSFVFLTVYANSYVADKVAKVIIMVVLILSTLVLAIFMLGVTMLGS